MPSDGVFYRTRSSRSARAVHNQTHLLFVQSSENQYFSVLYTNTIFASGALPLINLARFFSVKGKKLDELIEMWQAWRDGEKSFASNTQLYTVPSNYISLFLSFDKYSYRPLQFAQSRIRYSALVHKLREKTDFFSHSPLIFDDCCFEYLVTNLFVDLEAFFRCNSFCVSDLIYPSKEVSAGNRKNIGLACYRKSNFFNHSCVPNAAYSFENGDTIAVYSLRKIRPGEQVISLFSEHALQFSL